MWGRVKCPHIASRRRFWYHICCLYENTIFHTHTHTPKLTSILCSVGWSDLSPSSAQERKHQQSWQHPGSFPSKKPTPWHSGRTPGWNEGQSECLCEPAARGNQDIPQIKVRQHRWTHCDGVCTSISVSTGSSGGWKDRLLFGVASVVTLPGGLLRSQDESVIKEIIGTK